MNIIDLKLENYNTIAALKTIQKTDESCCIHFHLRINVRLSSCCLFGPLVGFLNNSKKKQTTAKYHPPSAADPSLPCLGLSRCSHQTFTPNLLAAPNTDSAFFFPRPSTSADLYSSAVLLHH